ncbi:uncharacterized protein LOC144298332 [Canis aureus]
MLAVRAARFAPPMHEGARTARARVQLRRRGSRPQPALQVPFGRRWVGGGCPCGCGGPSRWSRADSSRAAASPPVPAATVPVPREGCLGSGDCWRNSEGMEALVLSD